MDGELRAGAEFDSKKLYRYVLLHFSGSDFHRDPMFVVVEVMTAGALV